MISPEIKPKILGTPCAGKHSARFFCSKCSRRLTIKAHEPSISGLLHKSGCAFHLRLVFLNRVCFNDRFSHIVGVVIQGTLKSHTTALLGFGILHILQFAMPREWTLETLPEPLDSQVTLREIPARTVAVIRYSGTWSQHRYEKHLKMLQGALEQAGLRWHGAALWARYDPPWMPWFLRRNEIWLELD